MAVIFYHFVPADEELFKHAFMFGTSKIGKRMSAAASHGKFESTPTSAPRAGADIARILGEIAATAGQQ